VSDLHLKAAAVILGLIVLFATGICLQYYRYRLGMSEAECASLRAELLSAQGVITTLRSQLAAERTAVRERAERETLAAESHREMERELEVCDLDPDWAVPDVLYGRLCARAPALP
jgi:hypothetical protein